MIKAAIVLSLFAASLTQAQNSQQNPANVSPQAGGMSQDPATHARNEASRATKDLNLNQDQTQKWEQAAMERISANAPLRDRMQGATTPADRQALHSQIKQNEEKFESSLQGFLTSEQWTTFQQNKKNRQENRRERMQGGNQPGNNPR